MGVGSFVGSNPTMTDVTATASGGAGNHGAYHENSNSTIRQSKLSGSTFSLYQFGSSNTVKVALTQLVGTVRRDSGTLQCFNNYDQNMAAVTCT